MIEVIAVNNNNINTCVVHLGTNRAIEEKDMTEMIDYCKTELAAGNIISIKYKIEYKGEVKLSSNVLLCNIEKIETILCNIISIINKEFKSINAA